MGKAFGPAYAGVDPLLRPSQYADFQANVALAVANRLGISSRDVAARLVDALDVKGICVPPQISGPGFINLALEPTWVAATATAMSSDPRLGVARVERQIIPIDYSAPNVAKEMHVGHLRTTIVGDALARTLEHLGHHVVRQNHIGDWGTPFGMLIEHLLECGEDSPQARLLTDDPNMFYQAARAKFEASNDCTDDSSDSFAVRARRRVVALQAGDRETLRHWHRLVAMSTAYFNTIYDVLDVTLSDADLAGESTYNDDLQAICEELETAGIATMSEGALCVFLDGFTGHEGRSVPLIIRKSDGGYGYATTDLVTLRHRIRDLRADRILYVIGAPQRLHLQMVWATARKAGWLPDDVEVVHVQIGNMHGADGKILKTRSGAPPRLLMLLDQALERAAAVIDQARPELPAHERAAIARTIGIGAVKYADLQVAHDSSYTFDLDQMVSLTGNTGPYLQYAAARLRSILRRAADQGHPAQQVPLVADHGAEQALMLALLGFGEVIEHVGATYQPHRLCGYLFDLAQTFTTFYDQCPVLAADTPALRDARLALCLLTLAVLEQGLSLLGIIAPERM